jgi:hypothetical protein
VKGEEQFPMTNDQFPITGDFTGGARKWFDESDRLLAILPPFTIDPVSLQKKVEEVWREMLQARGVRKNSLALYDAVR